MTAAPRDLATRMLEFVLAALPAERADWGRAMRAELAGIDDPGARRGFAAGCARAVFSQPAVLRSAASTTMLIATAVVAVVLAADLPALSRRLEMCALTLAVVGIAWAGRRSAVLGPVAKHVGARVIRGSAYVVIGLGLISSLASATRFSGSKDHPATFVVALAVFLGFQMTMLAMTASNSRVPLRAVAIGFGGGAAAALAWFAESLSRPTFAANLSVPLVVALMAGLVAGLVTLLHERRAAAAAALTTVGTTLVLIAFLATAAMTAFTSKVPDIVGPVMVPGSTRAQKLVEDMIEVGDYYFGALALGGIAFAALGLLIVVGRPREIAVSRVPQSL